MYDQIIKVSVSADTWWNFPHFIAQITRSYTTFEPGIRTEREKTSETNDSSAATFDIKILLYYILI